MRSLKIAITTVCLALAATSLTPVAAHEVEPTEPDPAGTRLVTASSAPSAAPSAPSPSVERIPVGRRAPLGADSPTEPVPEIPMPSRSEVLAKASPGPSAASAAGTQEPLPDMPRTPPAKKKSRRRSRRSVPSWDEIVFGARPE